MNTAREPPSHPPPAYSAVRKVYKKDLRPVLVFFLVVSIIWATLMCVGYFREFNDLGQTAKLNARSGILGALCAIVVGTETFGLTAVILRRLPLIRIYALLALINCGIYALYTILRFVFHFVFKSDLIAQCILYQADGDYLDPNSPVVSSPTADYTDACNSYHRRQVFYTIIWLIALAFWGVINYLIAKSYYIQSKDPQFGRQFQAPASAVYQMNAYNQGGPGTDAPFQAPAYAPYNPGYAPPTNAPPPGGFVPPSYEAGDYKGPAGDEKREDSFENSNTATARGEEGYLSRVSLGDHLEDSTQAQRARREGTDGHVV